MRLFAVAGVYLVTFYDKADLAKFDLSRLVALAYCVDNRISRVCLFYQ